MNSEEIAYKAGDTLMKGELYYSEDIKGPKPCILVAHAWMGQDDFARSKARSLASLGYVGFAIDLYGNGKVAKTKEEAAALMSPLFMDRALLQSRLKAAFDVACQHPEVDSKKIGAIGFCFGGLAAIELFRSGAEVRGAVSFHAVLGDEQGGKKAKTVAIASGIRGSLLMMHGHDDPLVSAEDIAKCQKDLTDAHVDWQMHVFGNTSHAFTVPYSNDKEMGLIFNPLSEKRSWRAMKNFFEEKFR